MTWSRRWRLTRENAQYGYNSKFLCQTHRITKTPGNKTIFYSFSAVFLVALSCLQEIWDGKPQKVLLIMADRPEPRGEHMNNSKLCGQMACSQKTYEKRHKPHKVPSIQWLPRLITHSVLGTSSHFCGGLLSFDRVFWVFALKLGP